jgi:hypothetical protein
MSRRDVASSAYAEMAAAQSGRVSIELIGPP